MAVDAYPAIMTLPVRFWLASVLLGAGACSPPELGAAPAQVRSYPYFQALAAKKELEIHVDPGPAQRGASVLARMLTASKAFETFVLEEGDESDPSRARIVIGSADHPQAALLAESLGVSLVGEGEGFRFAGRAYMQPGDALIASFPDPDRSGLPAVLFYGNDEKLLARYLTSIPRPWEFGVEVFDEGELAFRAPLSPEGELDESRAVDFLKRREAYWSDPVEIEVEGITVITRKAMEGPAWKNFLLELQTTRANVQRWLGDARTEETVEATIYLYDHLEDMEVLFGSSFERFENPFRPRGHAPWFPFKSDASNSLARICARQLQGEPRYPWLYDGIAVAATGKWWGTSLASWVSHLKIAGVMPRLNELADPKSIARMSPHVLQPARGYLFKFLMQGPMKRKGRALWGGAPMGDKKLPVQFAQALKKTTVAGAKNRQQPNKEKNRRGVSRFEVLASPFRNGIALVDEVTPDLHSTYLSRSVGEQLAQAQARGADAFSLTVRGALAQRTSLVELPNHFLASSASDLALMNALNAGRLLRMSAMLNFQPMNLPSSTWADGAVMVSIEQREHFWRRYRVLVTHYALFAQLAGVDILSLGSNLREATGKNLHNKNLSEVHSKGWETLIRKAHLAYKGALTYSAQLGKELDNIEFWEHLDYIGVNFYPRMGNRDIVARDGVVERACVDALEEAITLANRWNRPLLLTEIGYPARTNSWSRPNVPIGEVSPEEQKRFLELFASAMRDEDLDLPVLRGIFLWNWSAAPSPSGESGPFDLAGTLAESALESVFAK